MDVPALLTAFEEERRAYLRGLESLQGQLDASKAKECALREELSLLQRQLSYAAADKQQAKQSATPASHLARTRSPSSLGYGTSSRAALVASLTPHNNAHQSMGPAFTRGSSRSSSARPQQAEHKLPSSSAAAPLIVDSSPYRNLISRLHAAEAAAESASKERDTALSRIEEVERENKAQEDVIRRLLRRLELFESGRSDVSPASIAAPLTSQPNPASASPAAPASRTAPASISSAGDRETNLLSALESLRSERDQLAIALTQARVTQAEGIALMAEMVKRMDGGGDKAADRDGDADAIRGQSTPADGVITPPAKHSAHNSDKVPHRSVSFREEPPNSQLPTQHHLQQEANAASSQFGSGSTASNSNAGPSFRDRDGSMVRSYSSVSWSAGGGSSASPIPAAVATDKPIGSGSSAAAGSTSGSGDTDYTAAALVPSPSPPDASASSNSNGGMSVAPLSDGDWPGVGGGIKLRFGATGAPMLTHAATMPPPPPPSSNRADQDFTDRSSPAGMVRSYSSVTMPAAPPQAIVADQLPMMRQQPQLNGAPASNAGDRPMHMAMMQLPAYAQRLGVGSGSGVGIGQSPSLSSPSRDAQLLQRGIDASPIRTFGM